MPRGGPRTLVNHVVVTGYEKRKEPSKHYVFVIDVTWDNDERYEIFRRYSDFFSLQETLKIVFPESFLKYADEHIAIPTLPKRKFFGRSHVEQVAEARVESINKYCKTLSGLDQKISGSKHVISFFSPKPGDKALPKLRLHRPATLHPMKKPAGSLLIKYCVIAAFDGEEGQISADSGDQVLLLTDDESGWCLVQKGAHKGAKVGWIPKSYLKKCSEDDEDAPSLGLLEINSPSSPTEDGSSSSPGLELAAQEYLAIDSYQGQGSGQISFIEGELITVLDKMEDGWWFVAKGENEGWVPCGYLEPVNQDEEETSESTEKQEEAVSLKLESERYITIAPYTAEEEDEISFPGQVKAEVIQKSLTGWWFIKCEGKAGLAPATFLKKVDEERVSDSGIESGDQEKQENRSFVQVPRQRTIRKKRSIHKNVLNKSSLSAVAEDTPSPQSTPGPESSLDNEIVSAITQGKPTPAPRTNTSSKDKKPPLSPKPVRGSRSASAAEATSHLLQAPGPPQRPRQSQIIRAWVGPSKHDDDLQDETTFVREKGFRRRSRSPSPSPKNSPHTSRKVKSTERESLSPPSDPDTNGHRDAPPYAKQMAESLFQYMLSSDDVTMRATLGNLLKHVASSKDPVLRSTLRDVILTDPQLKLSLKSI